MSMLKERLREKNEAARPRESLTLPVNGEVVEIRGLMFGEKRRYNARAFKMQRVGDLYEGTPDMEIMDLELIRGGSYDPETGVRLYGDDDASTAEIDALHPTDADAIAQAVKRLSGMGPDAVEAELGNSVKT